LYFYFLCLYKTENWSGGTSRVRTFALERIEDFFDGVCHGDVCISIFFSYTRPKTEAAARPVCAPSPCDASADA